MRDLERELPSDNGKRAQGMKHITYRFATQTGRQAIALAGKMNWEYPRHPIVHGRQGVGEKCLPDGKAGFVLAQRVTVNGNPHCSSNTNLPVFFLPPLLVPILQTITKPCITSVDISMSTCKYAALIIHLVLAVDQRTLMTSSRT